MKYLFIHQNFPGQFGDIARQLAAKKGNEVLALRLRHDAADVPGVVTIHYRLLHEPLENQLPLLKETEAKVLRAEAVAEAALRLRTKGWNPDVIVVHPGWGEAMYVKDVWPDAKLVCYFEYFYNAIGQDMDFDPEFRHTSVASQAAMKAKNAVFLQALQDADAGWSPSQWQRNTFPAWAREKISVINEGVDVGYFKPDPKASFNIDNKGLRLTADDEVITYAARSLEPVRGFHQFMRALPALLRRRPKAHVVIMGREAASYGPEPEGHASWLQKMLAEVGSQLDPKRVHVVGFLPKAQYRAVLQVSSAHVYLTYPFILSWSVLDAQACGAPLVASNTGPLMEAVPPSNQRFLFDFFDTTDLVLKLEAALNRTSKERAADEKKVHAWISERYGKQASLEGLTALIVPARETVKPAVRDKAGQAVVAKEGGSGETRAGKAVARKAAPKKTAPQKTAPKKTPMKRAASPAKAAVKKTAAKKANALAKASSTAVTAAATASKRVLSKAVVKPARVAKRGTA